MGSATSFRVSGGVALDRARTVGFRFNGRRLTGFAGDTLASALLANGVRVMGRSFKFHRPRGAFACGLEEPNALVELGSGQRVVPSARSTLIELHAGLEAYVPSGWPTLGFDLGRVLDFTAPLWAAGFYNKTFFWPAWHLYEPLIRRMAGFGDAPRDRDPDRYDSRNLHCDVLVVGGGITGLEAASVAADAGSRVVLVEQGSKLGGRSLWDGSTVEGISAAARVQASMERLARMPDVRVLTRTAAVGHYDGNVVALLETLPFEDVQRGAPRERYWIVRARRVVLATGAIEQPLVFCNNDRPGIMLAGAVHQYLRRYAVAVGRRVVVATNNDSAYAVVRGLKEAGIEVLAVADTRHTVPQVFIEALREASIPLLSGSIPVDTRGFSGLSGVTVGRLSHDSQSIESQVRIACDALAISGGWNPTLHLYSQAGGRLAYDASSGALVPMTSGAFWPATRHPSIEILGAATERPVIGPRVSPVGNTRRQWVDLRHDVTVADLELALRENFSSIEHVKRYTTVGMAVDQGKTSHIPSLEIVARLRGVNPAELGHTTLRPPFVPVTLGAIAGRALGERFAPSRHTPLHAWHVSHGAVLEDYGEWQRPAVYLRAGESRRQGIAREARVVRMGAGLFDASPLGKIEIHGPDALEFLDRFYINNLRTLKPYRVRYGLMLRESGVIFDDGTVVSLANDRILITTTSGNAARVAAWLEEWHQCEWPHLRVAIMPVTDQWGVISLAGPRARDILSRLDTGIDLSNAAFPHLTMRDGQLLGSPVRICRVSFSGELTYEINVAASAAQAAWDAILATGRSHGLTPFGVEALLLMRLEKGFLHVGSDTDGTTVPEDIGFGKIAAAKSADFVGKRSLLLPEYVRSDRRQLVGLLGDGEIAAGSHLRLPGSREVTDGWVTSAGRSVFADAPIALALVRSGRQRIGERVTVHDSGRVTRATVVAPPFFDPDGERMNA